MPCKPSNPEKNTSPAPENLRKALTAGVQLQIVVSHRRFRIQQCQQPGEQRMHLAGRGRRKQLAQQRAGGGGLWFAGERSQQRAGGCWLRRRRPCIVVQREAQAIRD